MWKPRHTEYRAKDYRTPRSMREVYGYEPQIYEEEATRTSTSKLELVICLVLMVLVYGIYKGVGQ